MSCPTLSHHPHTEHCCGSFPNCGHSGVILHYKEKAGDDLSNARSVLPGMTSARIDYDEDEDVYRFTPSSTKQYHILTICSAGADLDCFVKSNSGTIIASDTSVGQANIYVNLSAGSQYYLIIKNNDKTYTNDSLNIE